MTDKDAYIALNMMEGIGPVVVRALVDELGSPAAIFSAPVDALRRATGVGREVAGKIVAQRDSVDVDRERDLADALGVRIVTPLDDEYPEALKQIHDPPLALYVRGALEPCDRHSIAVVGTRRASHYGRDCSEKLAYQLARAGFTITSGLARGIDTAGHNGALKAEGRTIAVIGSAHDRLYPAENEPLARNIAESGAVVSEFRMGTRPGRTTFPMRNRVVSGMSMGILVVEAGVRSGAMITTNQALEQGRTVFAVPGRIDSNASRGSHELIRNGATLVESVDDVLREFEFLLPREKPAAQAATLSAPRPPLSADEQRLLDLLEEGERDVDTLTRLAELAPSVVSSLLIGMEMKRLVTMLPGRLVKLVQ